MDNSELFQKILSKWPIWAITAVSIFLLSYIYFLSGDKCCFYKNHPSCEKRARGRNHWSEANENIDGGHNKCKYQNGDKVSVLSVLGFIIFFVYILNFIQELNISDSSLNTSTLVMMMVYYSALIYFGFFMGDKIGENPTNEKTLGYWIAAIVSVIAIIILVVIVLVVIVLIVNNYFFNFIANLFNFIANFFNIMVPLSAFFIFVYFVTYYFTYYNYSENKIEKSKNLKNINVVIISFISFSMIYTMFMLSGLDDGTITEKYANVKDNLMFPIGTFIVGSMLYAIYNFYTCVPILNINVDDEDCKNKPLQSFIWIIFILCLAGCALFQIGAMKGLDLFLYFVGVCVASLVMIYYKLFFKKNNDGDN